MNYTNVKPFIKWAGGKSQLLNEIRAKYPENIDKYCEPFVGGGAVLFDVLANIKPQSVLINDINPQLINTYAQIRDNVMEIVNWLSENQAVYWGKSGGERREMYLQMRDKFNAGILNKDMTAEMAALFIFLNKTCFNGLYRVNSRGLFNVPIGSYKKPPICDAENLKVISGLLQNVDICCGDYSDCEEFIDANTFVYIDPPYRPLTETASFTSYANTEFGDKEQIELGRFIDKITARGAKVIASNSDPKNTNEDDDFFDNLYRSYSIIRVSATRMINSKASGRGCVNELLICNY